MAVLGFAVRGANHGLDGVANLPVCVEDLFAGNVLTKKGVVVKLTDTAQEGVILGKFGCYAHGEPFIIGQGPVELVTCPGSRLIFHSIQ